MKKKKRTPDDEEEEIFITVPAEAMKRSEPTVNQHQQSSGSAATPASAPTSPRPLTLDPTGGPIKLALFGFRHGLTHFPELEGGVELVSGRQQEDGVVDP